MDLLVKWRDGTENVVNSKELVVVNKPKTLQKGSEVRMLYEGEWHLGTVVTMEDEDSEDDFPLISFVGISNVLTNNTSHLTASGVSKYLDASETVNVKNSQKIQILQDITMKGPLLETTRKSTKKSDSLDFTIPKEVNKTLNITESVSKRQIFPGTSSPANSDGYQSNEETPYSDNSDLDPDYKIDCEMSQCVKKSQMQCACGFWLCKIHFFNINYCDIHEFRDQSLEGPAKLKKINQNNKYRKQNCEFLNCTDEIFAACHKCQALLCWTHFDVEEQECLYHKVPFLRESLQNVVHDNVKPSHFELEGSPSEIRRKNQISTSSMKNTAKKQKLLGEGYIVPKTMNQVPPKTLQAPCESEYCKKFGKKCHIFTNDQRNDILTCFYDMGSLQQQREYICRHVKKSNPKNMKENSRKKVRYDYFLPFLGENVCVCKIFFLNTLAISEKVMRTSLKKLQPTGVVETEKRGGRTEKQLERDAMMRKAISEHINLFPKIESHYCRKSTTKEYLHPDLSIPKMYEMYLREHEDKNNIGGIELYRKIFHDMNLSFHRPKKDQCSLCRTFREGNDEIKDNLREKYNKHEYEKTTVRKIKKESKEKALNQQGLISAVFDLQQVIHLPISNESALFYKQRLAVYNFTIYNLATRDCDCYTWNETIANRGAAEIATCLFMFLKRCDDEGKVSIEFFSDGCQGQNKNSILPAMFLYFLRDSQNVQNITHYFFESFHGQNEGDSVHSTISSAISRAGNIYVPSQIIPIIRLARRKHPYIVHELEVSDFLDFKEVSKQLRLLSIRKCSEDTNDSGNSINWTQFLNVKVEKKDLAKIYFKTSYSQENYKSLSFPRNTNLNNIQVRQLNVTNKKLSEKKYLSLLSLCRGLTPIIRLKEYQNFYKNLPH